MAKRPVLKPILTLQQKTVHKIEQPATLESSSRNRVKIVNIAAEFSTESRINEKENVRHQLEVASNVDSLGQQTLTLDDRKYTNMSK